MPEQPSNTSQLLKELALAIKAKDFRKASELTKEVSEALGITLDPELHKRAAESKPSERKTPSS